MSKVLLNKAGQFLHFSETSSHSPQKVYSYSWGELNNATLVRDNFDLVHLKGLQWKEKSPISAIAGILKAKEIRIVELLP